MRNYYYDDIKDKVSTTDWNFENVDNMRYILKFFDGERYDRIVSGHKKYGKRWSKMLYIKLISIDKI